MRTLRKFRARVRGLRICELWHGSLLEQDTETSNIASYRTLIHTIYHEYTTQYSSRVLDPKPLRTNTVHSKKLSTHMITPDILRTRRLAHHSICQSVQYFK